MRKLKLWIENMPNWNTPVSQKLPYIAKNFYACMRWFFRQSKKGKFTFSHLADAFIQSELQMRTMEAIKINKRKYHKTAIFFPHLQVNWRKTHMILFLCTITFKKRLIRGRSEVKRAFVAINAWITPYLHCTRLRCITAVYTSRASAHFRSSSPHYFTKDTRLRLLQ